MTKEDLGRREYRNRMWVRLAVMAAAWLGMAACTNATSAPDPEEAAAGRGACRNR